MNKPGCEVDELKGGVAGGSILKGVLKVGSDLLVRVCNRKIFFLFLNQNICCWCSKNLLNETVLLGIQNTCLKLNGKKI